MGINYNTKLLSFSGRNTAKHFRILREKGKRLLTAFLGWMLIIHVEHSEHSGRGEANAAAVSVTPSVTGMELSHALQPHAALKVPQA